MNASKKIFRFLLPFLAVFAISASFLACSSDSSDDDANDKKQEQTTTVTVTFYADTTSTSPRTTSIESGKTLSASLAIAPEGYTFKAWLTADGTDYTDKPITSNVTLFAYFEKSSSSTEGTKTITTTNEKSVETDKTTTQTTDSETKTTITEVSESTTKIDGTKIESESTKTEDANGTVISETSSETVTNSDGSKVETTKTEDGTTTVKTTDTEGKTEITVTDKDGNEKEIININEILLEKLGAASTATTFKPSAVAPATGTETHIINEDVNAVMWLDGTTIFYYCADFASGKKIPLGLSSAGMFKGCTTLTTIDMTGFDTSDCTDMSNMFNGCTALTSVDVSGFDTSKVTDMHNMFTQCLVLTSLDVSKFDTNKVTNMGSMFSNCQALISLDVSKFVTNKVTNMGSMFGNCRALTSIDVSNFDTSNVTSMRYMFHNCYVLTSIDVTGFNTSKVTDMAWMFDACKILTTLDLHNFDTSNVTTMDSMFRNCNALESLNVSSFNTINVTDMGAMFYSCSKLEELDLSNFDTRNVILMVSVNNENVRGMFQGCRALTKLDISNFDTSNVTTMYNLFYNCQSLESLDVSKFNTSKVTNMQGMFYQCYNLTELDVSKFDTSNVTDMGGMFAGCTRLVSVDLSSFDFSHITTVTYAETSTSTLQTSFRGMFQKCYALTTIYTAENTDLNTLPALSDDTNLFDKCYSLIGGSGTTYDSDHTDKTYARVDGGTSAPGYFTAKGSSSSPETPSGYVGSYKGELTSSWGKQVYIVLTINSDNTCTYQEYTSDTFTIKTGAAESLECTPVDATTIKLTVPNQGVTLTCTTADNWNTMTISGMYSGTMTKFDGSIAQGTDAGTVSVATADIAEVLASAVESGATKITLLVTDATDDTLSNIDSALRGKNIAVSLDLSKSTGLTTIKASTFTGRSNLVAITLPNSVVSIGAKAFDECSSLETVTLSEGLQTIGEDAFRYCESLKNIDIPEGVTTIGSSAFSHCSSLETFRIPAGVTSLSFSTCTKLTTITVADGNTSFKSIDNALYSADGATLYLIPGGSLSAFSIPDGVTRVEDNAFTCCSRLERLAVSATVTENLEEAFLEIPNSLKFLTVAEGNTQYKAVDNVLYSADGTILYSYPKGSEQTSFTIPSGVTHIASDAFMYAYTLESVTIPGTVNDFSSFAFYGCRALKTVNYTGTIDQWCAASFYDEGSNPLSNSAALYLNGVEVLDLVIPDSVTEISRYAFYKCTSIESVAVGQNVTKIGKHAFEGCSALSNATCSDTTSVWYKTSSSGYTGGTAIGAMSADDTAANAKALANTASYYLYKVTE